MSNGSTNGLSNDELKTKIEDVMEKIRTQAMLVGSRSMSVVIADMIDFELNKPGKRSMADMRRIVKKVRDFCQKAIDHPVEELKFGEEKTSEEE